MKKTLLSFLCIGSAFVAMAQQTRPISEPNKTNTTTNSTLNNNNSTLNNNPNGTVNGHNTLTNETRNNPGNNTMNNTPANSTLNGNTTPNGNPNGNTINNQNMNNQNLNNQNLNNQNLNNNTTTDLSTGTLGSNSANAAYSVSVPTSIQTSFNTAYPTAGTSVIWHQSGDWYRARYMENGKLMEASYREDGKSFTRAASPIMRTYVPEETVSRALQLYGMNVYAIARAKNSEGMDVYNVTIIENGQSRTEWMNEDGSKVTSPYRTEMTEQPANSNMNNTNEQTPAATAEPTDASNNTNSTTPVQSPVDNTMDATGTEQQTLEQGDHPEQVDENNNMNREGLNNGTTSDSLLRKRTDQSDANSIDATTSPEQTTTDAPIKE